MHWHAWSISNFPCGTLFVCCACIAAALSPQELKACHASETLAILCWAGRAKGDLSALTMLQLTVRPGLTHKSCQLACHMQHELPHNHSSCKQTSVSWVCATPEHTQQAYQPCSIHEAFKNQTNLSPRAVHVSIQKHQTVKHCAVGLSTA